MPSAEEPVVEETETSSSNQEVATVKHLIIEAELGTTGKSEIVDGKEYIYHYVPAGTYTVSAKSDSAKSFIVKREMEKNSSGFMESVTVSSHRISKGKGLIAVEVKSDERPIMVINSVVEFTKASP